MLHKIYEVTRKTLVLINLVLAAILMTGVLLTGLAIVNALVQFGNAGGGGDPIPPIDQPGDPAPPPDEPVPEDTGTFDPRGCDEGEIHEPGNPCYDYWNEAPAD
jgi:hypothetical protein